MLQYFEQQLNSAVSISAEEAAKMIGHRINNGGDEAELTEYYNSKIGKKILFFMKSDSTGFEIKKCFDDEVEETFSNATFIEMKDGGAVPVFTM